MINLEELNEFIYEADSGFTRIDSRNWERGVRGPFGASKQFITCGHDNIIRCWSPITPKSIEYKSIKELKDDTNI